MKVALYARVSRGTTFIYLEGEMYSRSDIRDTLA